MVYKFNYFPMSKSTDLLYNDDSHSQCTRILEPQVLGIKKIAVHFKSTRVLHMTETDPKKSRHSDYPHEFWNLKF